MRESKIAARLRTVLLLISFAAAALPAAAETAPDEPVPDSVPAPAQGPGPMGSERIWGEAYYQAVADDASSSDLLDLGIAQEAGLELNLRSGTGLEFISDFVLPLNPELDTPPDAVIQQLYIRVSPFAGVTLTAGKQRLNWGTAKVFSAIDTLEVRANPLDVRSVLSGVSGLKVEILPSDWFGLSLAVLPGSTLRRSRLAARADFLAEDLGLDLGIGVVKYTYLDRDVPAAADPIPLDRAAVLSDAAWSHESLVLYEEVQLRWGRETGYQFPGMAGFENFGGRDDPVFRGVGGMMLQLELGLARPATFLLEYLYNGDGLSGVEARSFHSRHAAWLDAGLPSGDQVPAALQGIGGFRRHYVCASLTNVALDRSLLLSLTGILGIDSLFSRFEASLEWDPSQATSIVLSYELYNAFDGTGDSPTELILIPFRNRLILSVSTSFG